MNFINFQALIPQLLGGMTSLLLLGAQYFGALFSLGMVYLFIYRVLLYGKHN